MKQQAIEEKIKLAELMSGASYVKLNKLHTEREGG